VVVVVVATANDAAPTQWRIPMARLTDTQLFILSTASRAMIRELTCRQTLRTKRFERPAHLRWAA
jgi:hypothetical protein